MSEIWFIRHAQSRANAGEVTDDTTNTELSAKGFQQREKLVEKIDREPQLVVATPFIRTQQTSEPTRKRYPQARYEIWDLHEFEMLAHEKYKNKTSVQRRPFAKKYWETLDPDFIDGPGAESFNMVTSRIKTSFQKLQQAPENFIVVFTHGRIMQIMRFLIERSFMSNKEMMAAIPDYYQRQDVANCEILRATANEKGIFLFEEEKAVFESGFKKPYIYHL